MQGRENAVFPRPAGRFETERDALPLLRIPFPAPRRNGLRSIQPKSPAEWLGISHTAPSFLLSAKSHARLACSVAVACKATSLITTARCRYQLFADLCLAALEIHFVSPLQQEEYRARQRAMLFFYPLCQGTRILPVQNADRRTNKGKGTVAQCINIRRD